MTDSGRAGAAEREDVIGEIEAKCVFVNDAFAKRSSESGLPRYWNSFSRVAMETCEKRRPSNVLFCLP